MKKIKNNKVKCLFCETVYLKKEFKDWKLPPNTEYIYCKDCQMKHNT